MIDKISRAEISALSFFAKLSEITRTLIKLLPLRNPNPDRDEQQQAPYREPRRHRFHHAISSTFEDHVKRAKRSGASPRL
jgi:hypothetical protein